MVVAENRLIAQLPRPSRLRLLANCKSVQVDLGTVLCQPPEPTRHVYFPIDCFVSLIATNDGTSGLRVGMVGREGMVGTQLALGVSATPLMALVQGPGTARRIDAGPFCREFSSSPALRKILNRYISVRMAQLATSAVCTRFHSVEQRLARCLLMSQDRAHSDEFHLTHEFLAFLLGVRRVGITTAASDLQRRGLIRYHRGAITVVNRSGLATTACACYAADNDDYNRLLA